MLDGENYTLIGVMPPGFDFPGGCGIWVPTSTLGARGINDRMSHPYHVLGRLRPGTGLSQAITQIQTIQDGLAKTYPITDSGWRVRAQPLLDEIVGNVRTSLLVLLGAVGFIFLIACTNVVNLVLARASTRDREFAIRAALGAGRMRLLRQNVTESFLIVAISLVLAVALARWGLAFIVSLTSVHLPRMEAFRLSVPVLAFLAAVAVLTALLVGLAPALQASRQDPQCALRDGQRDGMGVQGQRLRSGLIVSEVALAVVLLCGAGLMLRSFSRLTRVNPGFQTQHLLTMRIALPGAPYAKAAHRMAFFNQLLAQIQALPGLEEAAVTTTLPFSGESNWDWFQFVGHVTKDWVNSPVAEVRWITPNYFHVLGIPLLRGRGLTPADLQNHNTIVINEAMARKFWGRGDPIGQQIVNVDAEDAEEAIGDRRIPLALGR